MRFNGTLNDAANFVAEWYAGGAPDQYGNNRTGGRLGQFVYNKMGIDPWPELFYEKNPKVAEAIIYAEFQE